MAGYRYLSYLFKETLNKPGVYLNTETSKYVTGPLEDPDEDFSVPLKLDGKEYIIGDNTSRVYEMKEEGDVFAGFYGIGKFYNFDL